MRLIATDDFRTAIAILILGAQIYLWAFFQNEKAHSGPEGLFIAPS